MLLHLAASLVCVGAWASTALPEPRPQALTAEPQTTTEYEVKAAFLLKFMGYVKWPEKSFKNAEEKFQVAVVGPDPFGRVLDDAFKDKTVAGRKLEVKRFKTVADIERCHVLFVGSLETPKLAEILEKLAGSAVLTVCESPGSASRGAVINFVIEDKKVRFEINEQAAKRRELEVSSQLLKLAKRVKDEEVR